MCQSMTTEATMTTGDQIHQAAERTEGKLKGTFGQGTDDEVKQAERAINETEPAPTPDDGPKD